MLDFVENQIILPINNRKREYYINGIKYTEEKWKEMLQSREGLPWYKGSGARF